MVNFLPKKNEIDYNVAGFGIVLLISFVVCGTYVFYHFFTSLIEGR